MLVAKDAERQILVWKFSCRLDDDEIKTSLVLSKCNANSRIDAKSMH